MLLGAFVMVLVDHTMGFLQEGGNFIELETSGLVPNSTLLGIAMLVPIFVLWIALVMTRKKAAVLPASL